MEVKDLGGISEPLTKLVEEISKGIGGAYKPLGTVLNAKAEGYKIKKLADSKAYEIQTLTKISDGDASELIITNDNFEIKLKNDSLETRALQTIICKEIQNQINIDSIVYKAAELIEEKKVISKEPVDTDWMSRFINISKDISNEEMQLLWSKILSDEVSSPNTYSLRSLDILRNISSNEANLFTKLSKLKFMIGSFSRVINNDDYLKNNGILPDDLIVLQELNLVKTGLTYSIYPNTSIPLIYFDKVILIINKSTTDTIVFDMLTFTKSGQELSNLVDYEFDLSKAKEIANYIRNKANSSHIDIDIMYADIISIENGSLIKYREDTLKML